MTTLLSDSSPATVQTSLPLSMVERMTLIMEAFDRPLSRLTLDEVTQHTGLPRSTAHRILDQLVRCGWLIHTKTHYSLGSRALTLGGRERAQHELRSAASDIAQALAFRTGTYVHIATLAGAEVFYLEMFGGRNGERVASPVGRRAPAHCTAVGKAVLAALTPEYVDTQYANSLANVRTMHSIRDVNRLHQELARVRGRNGLALERGECFPDLACVGAAIRGDDGPVGGISIVTRRENPLEPLAPMVLRAAHTISGRLTGTARKTS
ncbi:IclR family transcriptional regulator [Gordonia sp. PKS22-38]|uniref:IclR family transcriptional regulator n=1 Tax=Gordonia prachuapensis TaxID=3115651 RepID=A0ABU7MSX0_9ACTN|nr:IclR family transcriptional regulator [Gordonia sp. PKS22-38]